MTLVASALEWKVHRVPWPFVTIPLRRSLSRVAIPNEKNDAHVNGPLPDQDVLLLADWFQHRMNHGDGTYQMFDQLCDVCIFVKSSNNSNTAAAVLPEKVGEGQFHVRCMEEMPIDYVTKHFSHLPRITLQFVYGSQHHGPKVFELGAVGATDGRYAESSTFLHPKMKFWKEGEHSSSTSSARGSDWNHHSVEDVPTDFSTTQHRPFLAVWVALVLPIQLP